jgi:hypothetical protein
VKVHPREEQVRAAVTALRSAVSYIWKSQALTDAEMLSVVTTVLSEQVLSYAKYAIRYERHGDTDKPGGLE